MPELRLRGDGMQLRITSGGILQRTFTAVESFTWTVLSEIIQKSYAGETTDRFDTINKGTSFEWSMDAESADLFLLMQTINDAGARRGAQASTAINIAFVANFPNGQRPRVIIPDLKIADPSAGFQNRESYVTGKFSGKASTFKISGV